METALFNDGYIRFAKKSGGWLRSFPRVIEWNGGRYLVEDWRKGASYLPTEFYAHEFLAVNPRNTASLLEFASRWGVPSHPCRYSGGSGWAEPSFWWDYSFENAPLVASIPYGYVRTCEERRMLAGIVESNAANGLRMKLSSGRLEVPTGVTSDPLPGFTLPKAVWGEKWGELIGLYGEAVSVAEAVSVTEASSVVEASQRAIRSLLEWIKHLLLRGRYEYDSWRSNNEVMDFGEAWRFVNCAATADILPIDFNPDMDGNIIAAVFDQLHATFLSPEPWKICGECGMPFKRKQNSPGAESKSGRYNPRALYCCEKCRNAHGNRRKGERIDHGI